MLRSSRNIFLTRKNIQKRKGGFTKKHRYYFFYPKKYTKKGKNEMAAWALGTTKNGGKKNQIMVNRIRAAAVSMVASLWASSAASGLATYTL